MVVQDVIDRIARHKRWYHQIEVAPGVVTPGVNQSPFVLGILNEFGFPRDMRGMRVLDLGCRDGYFSFEMERRGAEVVAIDYANPEVTGFPIAKELLGSNVEYVCDNIYDLTPEKYGIFDLTLFLGVLYHLRHPLFALDRVRAVTKVGATVFVETQLSQSETALGVAAPLWEYLPGRSFRGDATNKWAPNQAGLEAVLDDCGMKATDFRTYGDRGLFKCTVFADSFREHVRWLDSAKNVRA